MPFLVIGIQHHVLARIMLAIFDPNLPRIGSSRSSAVRAMEVCILQALVDIYLCVQIQVESSLKSVCGIALSNRWTPPGMFTAAMAIAICESASQLRPKTMYSPLQVVIVSTTEWIK